MMKGEEFMRQMILGINPGIHGMNYHDPSVCLVDKNGIIFAIEEERLNGIKHSCGIFPEKAVKECLRIADEENGEIVEIAVGHQPQLWIERFNSNRASFCEPRMRLSAELKSRCGLPKAKVTFCEHHKAHAASAFYCSGFQKALCIIIDGAGETASASVWLADVEGIHKLEEISMPNSLGYFYAAATSFVGFHPWSQEGKLMALAPYGKPDDEIEERLYEYFSRDFSVYDVSPLIKPFLREGFVFDTDLSNKMLEKVFDIVPREADGIITEKHKSFAYEVQYFTERAVEKYINKWLAETGCMYLCCAGGLFMNCKMNGYLRDSLPIIKMFVQPVAGDAGTALGSAFQSLAASGNMPSPKIDLCGLSLGLEYTNDQILKCLKSSGCSYSFSSDIPKDTARLLADKKIIAWFQGRCELGSRALCHRSILAPPNPYEVSDEINCRIKHREAWRPFACSVMEEYADEVLINYNKTQFAGYMIEAFHVNERWKESMQAVMHRSDFSTRPQIIQKHGKNSVMHKILMHYYELTGYPFVLNTSLNDKGQPIIASPNQAVAFFKSHDIDALVIGSYILRK